MWFGLRIKMTSSLYIVASVLAIPHWSRCEPFPHHCVGDTALTLQRVSIHVRTSFCDMSLDGMGEVLLSVVHTIRAVTLYTTGIMKMNAVFQHPLVNVHIY